jgi:hypothetical protein
MAEYWDVKMVGESVGSKDNLMEESTVVTMAGQWDRKRGVL